MSAGPGTPGVIETENSVVKLGVREQLLGFNNRYNPYGLTEAARFRFEPGESWHISGCCRLPISVKFVKLIKSGITD